MKQWTNLAGAIVSEVSASLALKGAMDDRWLYLVVVVGYIASFWFLTRCLQAGMPLGIAYGIWGALGVIATALASAALFGEPLTALMGVGIALVIAGVLTVELGSQRAHEREIAV